MAHPKAVAAEQRICFGIQWFATEADAQEADRAVRAADIRYNGGFYHGMPCGRDPGWDREVDGRKQYAVTY